MKKILTSVLIAAIGGLVAVGAYKVFEKDSDSALSIEERQQAQFASLKSSDKVSSAGNPDFTQAAAQVIPAVVYVETTYSGRGGAGGSRQYQMPFDDFFDDFFGRPSRPQQPRQAPKASGSGVIVTDDGYIITNNHVVENAQKVQVYLEDNRNRSFEAEVVGSDPSTDIALLKIDAKNLPFVPYGNSDEVQVGEWVLAVGNPFNLRSTVTAGIVSATARSIGILNANQSMDPGDPEVQTAAIESFIQTDAVINRGNSGGALVNASGELVGINSAIFSRTGAYEGYGFAVPISLAKKVVEDLRQYGRVQRGYIGVTFQAINPQIAKEKNLSQANGLYVERVVPGSAAEEAGLKAGDIITKMEDVNVNTSGQLMSVIGRLRPGDKVKATIVRDGKERNVTLTLKSADNTTKLTKAPERFRALGASVSELSGDEKQELRTENGVRVTGLSENSPLHRYTKIRKGFIITEVNGQKVNDEESINRALNNTADGMVSVQGFYADQPGLYSWTFPLESQ